MTSKILRSDNTPISSIKSVVFTEKINASADLRPGCVSSAYIDVTVYGAASSAPSAGEPLKYYQVDANGVETYIGTFYAEPSIQSRNTYSFVAYDIISKLDVGFSERLLAIQANFPMELSDLVSEACSVAGVQLLSTNFPMHDLEVQSFFAEGLTCRDILSYAAEIACRYVRCNEDEEIVFDWYEVATETSNASGAIASFETDASVPLDSLVCSIDPVQDLHGYSNPWPGGGGKNKLDDSLRSLGGHNVFFGGATSASTLSATLPAGTYTFTCKYKNSQAVNLYAKDIQTATNITGFPKYGSGSSDIASQTFTLGATTQICFFTYSPSLSSVDDVDFAIVESGLSFTSYAPYSNICPISGWTGANIQHSGADTSDPDTIAISWQSTAGTVYGGTLDVTTGVLTVTHALAVFDGSNDEVWYDYSSYNGYYISISTMKSGARLDGISNMLTDSKSAQHTPFSMWLGVNNKYFYAVEVAGVMGATLEAFKSYLSSHNLQVYYPLATPVTYQLTPTEVRAFLGTNNIWADTGNVSVDYGLLKKIAPGVGERLFAYKQGGLNYQAYSVLKAGCVAVRPINTENAAYIYPASFSAVTATDPLLDGNVTLYNLIAVDDGQGGVTLSGDFTATDTQGNVEIDSEGGSASNCLVISNNILLTNADSETMESVAEWIYTEMTTLPVYRPAKAELFPSENPFRAGDIVAVTDIQGISFVMPVMSMTVEQSAATVEATGNRSYAQDYGNDTSKQLQNLSNSIVQIDRLKVGYAEIDQAVIGTLEANGIDADWINAGHISVDKVDFNTYTNGLNIPDVNDSTTLLPGQYIVNGWIYHLDGLMISGDASNIPGRLFITYETQSPAASWLAEVGQQQQTWNAPAFGHVEADGTLDGATYQYDENGVVRYIQTVNTRCGGASSFKFYGPQSFRNIRVFSDASDAFSFGFGTTVSLSSQGLQIGKFVVDRTGNITANGKVVFTDNVNQIGTLSNLSTTAKTDLVSAINELYAMITS